MDPLGAILLAAVAGSVAHFVAAERRRVRRRAWREAARAGGLTDVRETEGFLIPATLSGRAGALGVVLETYRRGKHESGTRITVRGLRHGPFGLRLRGEGLSTSLEKALGEREIEIGDPVFDAAVYVQGQAPLARALLDASARPAVASLLGGRVEIEGRGSAGVRARLADDALTVEVRGWPSGPELAGILAAVLGLATRLVAPADVPRRIAANLHDEPQERVRLQGLLTLLREYPDHAATRDAVRAAREDESDEVRLRAGLALGEEGRPVLRELALRETADDSPRARAIEALGDLGAEAARAILGEAVRAGHHRTALACLATLGRHGGEAAIPTLAGLLGAEAGEVGAAAARALGETGSPSAEAPLTHALESGAGSVRLAAAQALGRVGTVAAVPPLRDAASRCGGALRGAVRQAIAEIQSRVSGAAPGQLSLAAGETGQLSLTDEGREGRLSLSDEEAPAVLSPGPRASRGEGE